MKTIRIALVGDYDPAVPAHQAIPEALQLSGERVGVCVEPCWMHTSTLGPDVAGQLAGFAGTWCVPASPYASTEGALAAIRFARESSQPFLGTCGGFQHALLEYARTVLGHARADHAETAPEADMPLIARLSCSLVEQRGRIVLVEGSRLRRVYGADQGEEGYRCNYGLNPRYESIFHGGPLQVAARDAAGEVRAVELTGHPFFIATLFQPERAALQGAAHPLVTAFVEAAAETSDHAAV
jgi:CTP synthase (UTP-ammonia lyase)